MHPAGAAAAPVAGECHEEVARRRRLQPDRISDGAGEGAVGEVGRQVDQRPLRGGYRYSVESRGVVDERLAAAHEDALLQLGTTVSGSCDRLERRLERPES